MEKELAHSLNIQLSKKVINGLKGEQEKLSKKFREQRFYDSSPHLAIATKFMGEENTNKFVEALKNEFHSDIVWELEFADFGISETLDYVFLHLSPESKMKIIDLHNRTFQATKNIGLEIQTGKKFRHFDYNPHISIIKLSQEKTNEALSLIKSDFSGVKMPVSCFEITRQTDDEKGFSNFSVIGNITLKNI